MNNFSYCNPTKMVFGKDSQKEAGRLIKPDADRILLHYGSGSIKKSGLYDEVITSLKDAGIEVFELAGVVPNPRLSLVHEGIDICRKNNIEYILAVGGGSVIDSAKAIALGVHYENDVWDFYYKGTQPENKVLKVSTILTIPAAGSESSPDTVITNEETELKIGYTYEKLRPVFSIVNPELFFTLPKNQLAYGVCDMMSHIMERYFTNTINTDLIDGLSESTLKTIMKNALIAKNDMKNYEAWAEIALSGSFAHNGFLGMGREQDWSCHGMEHELSAIYDVPHGAGLAVMTPAWMKYVYKDNIPMFVQFAVNVMGVEGSFREPEKLALDGIEKLTQFFVSMGLPITMKELGIDKKDFEIMAKKATGFNRGTEHPIGGFKKLLWEDIYKIFQLADE